MDRNRTLLPRVDVIYLLTRIMTLVGVVWFALVGDHPIYDTRISLIVVVTYTLHLAVFAAAIRGRFDLKLAYLSAIIYDILSVPLFVHYTGSVFSAFYLVFFLTVSAAAYVLTFWFAMVVIIIVTLAYLAILLPDVTIGVLHTISMRIGFLWVWFLAISYASDYLRRSERRLLKLFDTLNMRTSELEKSQAQLEMNYENTRILASILKPDAVVTEIMRIMGWRLQFEHFAVIFQNNAGAFYYRARSVNGHNNFHLKAIDAARSELIRKVCELDEPIRIKNLADRDDYVPVKEGARSAIIVPLTAHGNMQGLLITESCAEDAFTDKDVQTLTIVARSAALALENAELHRRTEELTIIDDLTDTYNYRYFVQKLQEERKRAMRYNLPLSIIMVDIDWFKKLNDSHGHEVGNLVLTELARVIKRCIRDVDVFARYGGEEFVIILPQTAQVEASVIGERIRQQVEETVVDSGPTGKVGITVSIGVSSYPENGKSAEDLVSVADQALYRAKGSGKNLVCIV
ncbi:MAG TPA: diguanylate cyclase [Acidobacteriota bacterium]|nr:diguanylate cyclase [Acidobacteriota bacterium]